MEKRHGKKLLPSTYGYTYVEDGYHLQRIWKSILRVYGVEHTLVITDDVTQTRYVPTSI